MHASCHPEGLVGHADPRGKKKRRRPKAASRAQRVVSWLQTAFFCKISTARCAHRARGRRRSSAIFRRRERELVSNLRRYVWPSLAVRVISTLPWEDELQNFPSRCARFAWKACVEERAASRASELIMCFGAAATQPFSFPCRQWPSEGRASERRPWTRARARREAPRPGRLAVESGPRCRCCRPRSWRALPPAAALPPARGVGLPLDDGAGALGQPVAALPAFTAAGCRSRWLGGATCSWASSDAETAAIEATLERETLPT